MVNVAPPKYTVQIGPTFEPEVAAEFATWAEMRGVSIAQLVRECAAAGLAGLRVGWAGQLGRQLDPDLYAAHLEHARRRGDKAVANRRAYDEETRRPRGRAEGGQDGADEGEEIGAGDVAA